MQCRQGVTQPRVAQGETALKIEGRFYFPSLVPPEPTVRVARSLRSLTLLEEPPGMSRPLLNSAGRALPVDDAMRLSGRPQVSV